MEQDKTELLPQDFYTGDIVIFKSEDGSVHVDVVFSGETVWLTMDSMAKLFDKSRSTINERILNIFKEGELKKEASGRKIGISDFSQLLQSEFHYFRWLSRQIHSGDKKPEECSFFVLDELTS